MLRSECLRVCRGVCPCESLQRFVHTPVRALFPSLYHRPCSQVRSGVSPCDGPGGVCFLSGPELWSERDRGATKAGTSALPDPSEQSGPLGVLSKPPWDLEFWNVRSLTLASYRCGNRPQMGRRLARDIEHVGGHASGD